MRRSLALAIALAGALAASTAGAIELRGGMGGAAGYGSEFLAPNDDGFAGPLPMPFSVNFFGNTYSQFFANNNGNITFGSGRYNYTPIPFPVTNQPMIAPYWGDVDTRCGSCGLTYVGSAAADQFSVTWHDVGFYYANASLTNDFQLTLFDRSDTGAGNFDIEFRYNRLEWTTGDASGGAGGLGGTPAQAGYDAGDGEHFFTLPGSQTSAVLDLDNTSNVSNDTPGLWFFTIRNGAITDGSTPDTALVPTVITDNGGYQFDFDVAAHQVVYVDPLVATGYDFEVLSGPNILSAIFPLLAGQVNPYQIFSFDGSTLLGSVLGGVTFNFASGGVHGFQLRGINPGLGLDPGNPLSFVTGLTFDVAGGTTSISLVQTPVTIETGGNVPEPAAWALLILGFGAVGATVRARRRSAQVCG